MLALNMAHATPRSVEFWFFSAEPGMADGLIKRITAGPLLTQNFDCVPMGEGCFHPQLGYISEGEEKKQYKEEEFVKPTLDTNLIDCDKNYHFDLYCGVASKRKATGTHIWFDISTSMRRIAPGKKGCPQAAFIRKIESSCGDSITISLFNTRLISMSSADSACSYMGLNNRKRLVTDIKELSADRLIVITDTDEYMEELRTFIDDQLLTTVGLNHPVTIGKLDSIGSGIYRSCPK